MIWGIGAIWLAAVLALALCLRRGTGTGRRALADAGGSLLRVAPVMMLALPMAAFMAELIPDGWARAWLGPASGASGILIAALAGSALPGGPFVAFPLVLGFLKSGAGPAQMVALISGWAVLGLHRAVTWEIAILGSRFVWLRLSASFALPVLAGLAAQAMLPFFPGAALR
ncbi:hypothetical protein [Falsiroseomonas sp. CW058]|uniref:hypothetical protein n=1 Tax=Falsiroseomonas sp. CW058 TaxID=3388664 RepID=UPI003D31AC79